MLEISREGDFSSIVGPLVLLNRVDGASGTRPVSTYNVRARWHARENKEEKKKGGKKRGHSYTWCGESLGLRRGCAWTPDDAGRRRAVRPQEGSTARQGAAASHVISAAAGRRILGRLQSEGSLSERKTFDRAPII